VGRLSNAWGQKKIEAAEKKYDADYFRAQFNRQMQRERTAPIRMALVGKENTAKTGLALSLALEPKKRVLIFDFDCSAESTVEHISPNDERIQVFRLFDELDESIFNDDNSTDWAALIRKTEWFISLAAEEIEKGDVSAVIFDGGSTFMKWCEFAMTWFLMNRSKNPINVEDGDRFNQAEWRTRNKLFRDCLNRVHSLPVNKVFFTFHLKDHRTYVNDGSGKKVLMTVGAKPDWVDGTQRIFSQQIFLERYMKEADPAAGVSGDKSLDKGEWVVRGTIEEMKGKGSEHIGQTYDILHVKNNKATWNGLPDLGLI
jgi:hypothetical protein